MEFLKRRWRETVLWLVNTFLCGTRMFTLKRTLLNTCVNLRVGHGSRIVGPIKLGNCSCVTIGKDCWIGAGMTVYGDGSVTIGDNCDLAPDVAFITGSHEIGGPERRAGKGKLFSIEVGNGCWLGARCAITNSVSVGNASIVAACALVNKPIPANSIAAGIPAKMIREMAE